MKQRTYESSVHFYGILWDIAALAVFLMLPVCICLHLGVWPEAKYVFEGLLPVALLFYPTSVIEVFTYTPLLGAGGTYLSFVTGNITNLKLPCGLNAMENAGVPEKDAYNVKVERDRENGIPWFSYEISPVTVTGYYEDVYSLSDRLNLYHDLGAVAVGFWCLGQEDPRIWQYLSIKKDL